MAVILSACSGEVTVIVHNPLSSDRLQEIVEISLAEIENRLGLAEDDTFVVCDETGSEIPYQITYDGKVIFPVMVSSDETQRFSIRIGIPSEYPVQVCGAHYPEREDDICWENDLTGYRAYGFKDDLASGYDLFVKRNTDLPIIRDMYSKAFDPEMLKIQKELEKIDKDSADRFNYDHMTIHVDHGYGMDCYGVGRTLGAGVAALMDEGAIIYPFCYDSYEILDNGPLRFTLKLVFRPFDAGECSDVIETRIISLDLGSHFSRTSVSYAGLDKVMPIVTGIVVQDMDGKAVGNAENGYIAYPAPTINYDKQRQVDNGTIYVGHVFPYELESAGLSYFSEEESADRGGAKGHILAHSQYDPQKPFIYYWGFGWNHADIASYEDWLAHLEAFSAQLRTPLKVSIR